MSISIEFMGLKLPNPIIVAAGPWSRNGEMIKKAFQAGAGAVVTETIVNEVNPDIRPRIAYKEGGVQNIRLYSDILVEEWEKEIQIGKSKGGIVITNICAQTPSEIKYLALKMEKAGADAIELGLASPMGEGLEVLASSPEKVYELTKATVESVKIPVMVKLSQNVSNMAKVARAVEKAGGKGISAIDTVRCILGVDIKTRKPLLSTYGGYSGPPIKPLGLASVATISQSTRLPVCGIGGITNHEDLLEYIMLGASVVQIGTSLMIKGFSEIEIIKENLSKWMTSSQIESIYEIRGAALPDIMAFDELQVEPKTARLIKECTNIDCENCKKCCIYFAITKENGQASIDRSKCRGCGLCCNLCPDNIIKLEW